MSKHLLFLATATLWLSASANEIKPAEWRINTPKTGEMKFSAAGLELVSLDQKVGVAVYGPAKPATPGQILRLRLVVSGTGTLEVGMYGYGSDNHNFLGRTPQPMEKRRIDSATPSEEIFYLKTPGDNYGNKGIIASYRICLRVATGRLNVAAASTDEVAEIPVETVVNHLDVARRMEGEILPVYTEPNLLGGKLFASGLSGWKLHGDAGTAKAETLELSTSTPWRKTVAVSPPISVTPGEKYILTGLYQCRNAGFGSFGELLVVPESRASHYLREQEDPPFYSSFSGRELYNRRDGDWQRLVQAYTPPQDIDMVRVIILQYGTPCTVRWSGIYFGLGPWNKDSRNRDYDWNKYVNNLDPQFSREETERRLAARENAVAELRQSDYPRIHVNGKVVPSLVYFGDAFNPTRSKLQDFLQAGVNLQIIPLLRNDRYWRGNRDYDLTEIDRMIWDNVQRNPDGNFIVALSLTPYENWGEEFSNDVARDASGKASVSRHGRKSPPCYWSDSYREHALHYIHTAVAHMRQQPYFKAVVGIFITGNEDGQFYYQVARGGRLEDGCSPAAQQSFRRWLKEHYENEAALREAWHQPAATFDTASVSLPERIRDKVFHDPAADRLLIDLTRFLNESMGDFANAMCAAAKGEAGKPILSVMWWGRGASLLVYPHFAQTAKVFPADSLDLMGAQPGYRGERHAGCSSFLPWITDSARTHRKLMMCEADFRTWTSPINSLLHDSLVVRYWSRHDLRGAMFREAGKMFSVGGGMWWYDMTAGWFKDPAIMEDVTTIRRIGEKMANRTNVFSPSEIVFVSDEDNYYYTTEQLGVWNGPNYHSVRLNQRAMLRSGLKFDFYYLRDLVERKMTGYKAYVFMNAFHLRPEQRDFIENELKKDGKLLVWLYAPGYLTEHGFSVEAMSKLTGIKLAEDGSGTKNAAFVDSPLTSGLVGKPVGVSGNIGGIRFKVDDQRATALMRYRRDGAVAGAILDSGSFRSIYLGVPAAFTPEFLQNIARHAGVHVYNTPGDMFMHRRDDLICLHGVEGNNNRIRLPDPAASLLDLVTGKPLSATNGVFEIKLEPGETRLLEVAR